MLRFSGPARLCSTAIGRCLFNWFCIYEDCMRIPNKKLLPEGWRQGNLLGRRKLMEQNLFLSQEDYISQLLDVSWAELWCLTPRLLEILATIAQLKLMKHPRTETAVRLQSEFQRFYGNFAKYITSSPVMEVLRPLPPFSMITSKHRDCCLPPPFSPHFFQDPHAGFLHLLIQYLKIRMRFLLYLLLNAELEFELEVADLQDATFYSFELCRTFAGIECQFDRNNAIIFPCFAPMVMAALNCSPKLRPWVFAKLRHFEEQGQICADVVKESLARLWEMPEIEKKRIWIIPTR
jgi:hypothetical protein